MNKKGQSISINTIIIAAIALAVLVVLFMIFTGRLGLFSKGVGEATNCDQACKAAGYSRSDAVSETTAKSEDCPGTGGYLLPGYSIIQDGVRKKCCCFSS